MGRKRTLDSRYNREPAKPFQERRLFMSQLGPLTGLEPAGPPRLRGGFVNRNFDLKFGSKSLRLVTYAESGAHGRWEQFLIMPQ